MFRHAFISILAFLFFRNIYAQDGVIQLENPSFEGEPKAGQHNAPFLEGWLDCGFAGSTPPDVQPETGGGSFGVTLPPNDGKNMFKEVQNHLTDADLTGVNLTEANLTGANLTGANLTTANLNDANLK